MHPAMRWITFKLPGGNIYRNHHQRATPARHFGLQPEKDPGGLTLPETSTTVTSLMLRLSPGPPYLRVMEGDEELLFSNCFVQCAAPLPAYRGLRPAARLADPEMKL